MSDRVVFIEMRENTSVFEVYKLGSRHLKTFCYRNNLVLGLVETYFLGVNAYVSLERATTGVR